MPFLDQRAPGCVADLRLEHAVHAAGRGNGGRVGEKTRRDAGQQRRTEGRRLEHRGPLHRPAEHVGLHLHEKIVGRGAAVDPQPRQGRSGILLHRGDHVGD